MTQATESSSMRAHTSREWSRRRSSTQVTRFREIPKRFRRSSVFCSSTLEDCPHHKKLASRTQNRIERKNLSAGGAQDSPYPTNTWLFGIMIARGERMSKERAGDYVGH